MVPPAPVTRTRRPLTNRAIPSRSSGTCGRFNKSSIATGASGAGSSPEPSNRMGGGIRRTVPPAASACATNSAKRAPSKSGSVTTIAEIGCPWARNFARIGAACSSAPRIGRPCIRRPTLLVPWLNNPTTR